MTCGEFGGWVAGTERFTPGDTMSNRRKDQPAAVAGDSPEAGTEGSIDLHYIMASLEAFNAEIAVHLHAERSPPVS